MAIKFVDVEPEGEPPKPKRSKSPERMGEPEAVDPVAELPHAKPQPKPRGRKKPLGARPATDRGAPGG